MPPTPWNKILQRIPAGSGIFTRALKEYLPGNKLTLLSEGHAVFSAMWAAIDSAEETIHLESYMFKSDKVGQEFSRRLQDKARAGVRVRVIYDSIGSMGMDSIFANRLRNAGVQLLEYHPMAPWRPRWSWGRRDHRKILVVDGRIAFVGGVNISNDHAALAQGGANWRDIHAQLEGPAVYELERLFRSVWFKETRRYFPINYHEEAAPGKALAWVAANQEFLHRYKIRSAYLAALRAAKKEILIAHAYFLPDRRMRPTLAAAARRGVEVKILVPGRSDIKSVWRASRSRYDYLLSHGIRIFEWPGPVLHEKAAAVDETWSAVGSYNIDHRSLLHNLEVNLHVLDSAFSKELCALLHKDIAQSREIKLGPWRQRSWREKILERFFYLFRYFF